MAYEMVMPYHLHMPSYFLETFTEYPYFDQNGGQLKLKVTGSDGKEIPFTHLYAH